MSAETEIRCNSDEKTLGKEAGFSGTVQVIDLSTDQSFVFGDFDYRPMPTIVDAERRHRDGGRVHADGETAVGSRQVASSIAVTTQSRRPRAVRKK